MHSEHGAAGEPGAVAVCQRVLAGTGGVARSAVAAFVPRRRVGLETRGNNSIENIRVYKGRSGSPDKIQAVLILATELKITEREVTTQSE